ncbi:MAG: bifunctional DNA-binding transcriptional regulator/O6-methylguanine-DNA methyltransferase Ada [Acidimicrobiales bacterium]
MPDLDDARWSAVAARDATVDGVFLYAVRSTRVFCRPSCPSRRPRRENVEFFSTPAAASAAGFRPCRRCRPESMAADRPTNRVVVAACRALEAADPPPDLAALAVAVGRSPQHLQRLFTRVVGVSPRRYADTVRLQRVKRSLHDGRPVTEAVYDAGYGSARGFYERASLRLGMAPSAYRAGAPGVEVGWAVGGSAVGPVLVAATERGLCAVRLGPDPADLVDGLAAELPGARLCERSASLGGVLDAVATLAGGRPADLGLPLDVAGTAFQARVWDALRAIPAGETRSYAEVAAAVGAPGAARAVGSACGANPVAVVVPCHRVVRADGSLGGYRWGLELKSRLLAAEATAPGEAASGEPVPSAAAPDHAGR